jgi:hypothetical protein
MADSSFREGDALASSTIAAPSGSGSVHVQKVQTVASDGTVLTSANGEMVQGSVASAATDAGNPVKVGGVYNSTLPTFTTGQRGDLEIGARGSLRTELFSAGQTISLVFGASNTDAIATGSATAYLGLGYVYNGSTIDRARGDINGAAVSKGLSGTRWRYTSGASPILSNTTTAVTIKTAGAAGVKNAIDSIQLTTTAFGASVPLAIRDGAGGTVLWALTVPTAGFLQPVTIVFEQPIVGSAATLLEVVTTTANTSGTVTLNVQGHTET